jgi:hypothetical protein
VLDRFVGDWPSLQEPRAGWDPAFATDAAELQQAASAALAELAVQCRAGKLSADCGQAPVNLLRDVRVSVSGESAETATAVAELVDYVKRPTSVLWVLQGTELVPVSRQVLLRLELRDIDLPEATTVAVLIRESRAILTRPETRLREGDKLLVITSSEREDELRSLLIGE